MQASNPAVVNVANTPDLQGRPKNHLVAAKHANHRHNLSQIHDGGGLLRDSAAAQVESGNLMPLSSKDSTNGTHSLPRIAKMSKHES